MLNILIIQFYDLLKLNPHNIFDRSFDINDSKMATVQ